jgi:hypothetical protein
VSVSTIIEFDKSRIQRRSAIMADTQTRGGFPGDPAEALSATGTEGCCGNPPQVTLALPEPAGAATTPCCGTATAATAEGSCCGSAAKADAVASGQGCCG